MRSIVFYGLILLVSNSAKASVYITKIINNTKQTVAIEYPTPTGIQILGPGHPSYKGPALVQGGFFLNPMHKSVWNVHLQKGAKVSLENAYIPTVRGDELNGVVIKIDDYNSFSNSLDSIIAVINVNENRLEKKYPMRRMFFSHFPRQRRKSMGSMKTMKIIDSLHGPYFENAIPIINELIDGSSYTLEIRQTSDEIAYLSNGKLTYILEAFELIFTQNDLQS